MRCVNYMDVETRRIADSAFPYYVRKCTHIMYTCFIRVDPAVMLADMRKEVSRKGGVIGVVSELLSDGHIDAGYMVWDIESFFLGMLQRYTVPRILEAVLNPDRYANFKPDKNFKLFPGHPDYLTNTNEE